MTFKIYTGQSLEHVENYLTDKGLTFNQHDFAFYIDDPDPTNYGRAYQYFYTTGRWAPWYAGDGYPPKHYNATGIVDFYTRFLLNAKPRLDGLKFSKDDDEALEAIRNLYSQFDNGPGTYMLDDGKEWSYISDGLYMSSDGSFYDDGSR